MTSGQPPEYAPSTDFSQVVDFEPTDLDPEFDGIALTIAHIRAILAAVVRDDWQIKDGAVKRDTLDPSLYTLLLNGPASSPAGVASGTGVSLPDPSQFGLFALVGAQTVLHWSDGAQWHEIGVLSASGLRAADAPYAELAQNLADLPDKAAARTSLQLQAAALRPVGVVEATDVLDRAAGDGRYLRLSGGTVTGATTFSQPVTAALPTAAGHLATKEYVDLAGVAPTEIEQTHSPPVTLFDGADEGTWKTIMSATVTLVGNKPVAVDANADLLIDQVTEEVSGDVAPQAGPGGPLVDWRLVRDPGTGAETELFVSQQFALSIAGQFPAFFAEKIDLTAIEGQHTYELQVRWVKSTYSAGLISVVHNDGVASFTATGTGTHWASYMNPGWEIRVFEVDGTTPIGSGDQWHHIADPSLSIINPVKQAELTVEATNWPNDLDVTDRVYTARNPQQKVLARTAAARMRVKEFRA